MDAINLSNLPDLSASLELSDEGLGALLWALAVREQARDLAIPLETVPMQLAELVTSHLLTLEAETARLAAVEKALYKVGCGDFNTAGRLLREILEDGAAVERFLPAGINRLVQAKEFGSRGAEENREVGRRNREKILRVALDVLAEWKSNKKPSQNALAERVSRQVALAVPTVKVHLSKLKKDGFLD